MVAPIATCRSPLTFAAACTKCIRIGTVTLAPLRHPAP